MQTRIFVVPRKIEAQKATCQLENNFNKVEAETRWLRDTIYD